MVANVVDRDEVSLSIDISGNEHIIKINYESKFSVDDQDDD